MADPNSNSVDSHKESASLDAERVLDGIDFEIERLDSQQGRKGWTLWAVLVAIASGLWLLLDQLQSSVHWLSILQLILCMAVAVEVFTLVNQQLNFSYRKKNLNGRFRPANETNRLQLLIQMVRYASLFCIALIATAGVRLHYRLIVLIVFGFLSLINAAGFLVLTWMVSVIPAPRKSLVADLILWIIIISLTWSCYGYLSATWSSPDRVTLVDVRIAGLIVAITSLLRVLANESTTPPLLFSLIEIRRDLALGRIDVKHGADQLDIAILGLRIEDAFQEDVSKILKLFETVNRKLADQQPVLDRLPSLPSRLPDV